MGYYVVFWRMNFVVSGKIAAVAGMLLFLHPFLWAEEPAPATRGSQFDQNNRTVPPAHVESPLSVVASDKDGLDLAECFRLAAIRSDTLQISAQDIRAAQARVGQAIAQLFPTINFVNSQNFQNATSSSSSFSTGSSFITTTSTNRSYSSSNQLTLSQTIFNGFTNVNNIGAARADESAQRYSLQRGYQTLYQSVAQAFYQILTDQGDLVILGDTARVLETRVQELEDRVRIGRSRPAELLQAKADLAAARVTVEQTKGLLAVARELMAFYLGLGSDKIKLRETQPFPTADDLEKYLRVAGSRPDILAQVEEERMARRNLSAAKGALWPQVSATGSYDLADDPSNSRRWTVALQVQLPLFDGGLIVSKIREQQALTRQSELNVESLRRTADQDIRTALANFDASAGQVVRLREQVEMAALNYNAQADDYKSGIVSNLDVLTALSSLQDARRQLNTADMNARVNLINLHVAAGLAAKALSGVTTTSGTLPLPVKKVTP